MLLAQVGIFGTFQDANAQTETTIPDWIKQLSKFWSNGEISDTEFASAIEFLIKSKIITSERISIIEDSNIVLQNTDQKQEIEIPNWIKNNAGWFADDLLGDADFLLGLEYMVENELIKSPKIVIIKIESDSDGDGILDENDRFIGVIKFVINTESLN